MAQERILIVEDESAVSEMIERVLQRAGFSVVGVVESGEAALACAARTPPDLVLMDIGIQGSMDGLEVAGILQQRHHVAVVFLTGQTDQATLARVRASGSFGYLLKPFRLEELIASVQLALAKHREAVSLRETERALSAAIRSITDAVVLGDAGGLLRFANPVATTLLGAAGGALTGRPLAEVLCIHSQGAALDLAALFAEVGRKDAAMPLPSDATLATPAGGEIPIEGSVAPVRDATGGDSAVVLAFRDITRRRQAQQELAQSREELRRLAAHLQTAREEERTLIAREIHDELGQLLTGLKMDLSWLEKRLAQESDEARRSQLLGKAGAMNELLQTMVQSVRHITAELRPRVLDDVGLAAGIEWLASEFGRRTGLLCRADAPIDHLVLPPETTTALFRICQEALTNVMRHAHARRVQVELWEDEGVLRLRVQDDGRGIRPEELAGARSFGLLGMRERATLLGGEFHIAGTPDRGTTVTVKVPLSPSTLEAAS